MKRLLSIILVLCCFGNIYSQQITLDFCVGTWEYKNPATGEELLMILKKSQYEIPRGFGGGMKECLVGGYVYKKNGVKLVDCMAQLNKTEKTIFFPILIDYFKSNDNYLDLTIDDFNIKNGYGHPKVIGNPSKITLYSTSPKQIKMEIIPDEQEEVYLDDREVFARGTTLPRNMILTKIE